MTNKTCTKCGVTADETTFAKHSRQGDGWQYHPLCKPCYNARATEYYQKNKEQITARMRERNATDPEYRARRRAISKASREADPRRKKGYDIKALYGITMDEYEAMLESQDNSCKICGAKAESDRNKRKHLDIDHYGGKGKNAVVRGILCNACNLGIGKFDHDPELLRKAAGYLDG